MNILYCGDANTEDGLLISILSLLKNNAAELHIYLLTMELAPGKPISDRAAAFLDQKVKEKNSGNFVRKLDITQLFQSRPPKANLGTRFTPCCMLRLYADLVEELPERILYLDNDVVCRKSIERFYSQDMDQWEVAGVPDYYGKWFFGSSPFRHDYINSGVLLLNMKNIRRTGLFARCREMCAQKKMFMPDQSAINKLASRKKLLPRCYNEQRKLHEDTVMQHFTTSFRFIPWPRTLTVKPWQVERMHTKLRLHEYDDLLAEYERLIPGIRPGGAAKGKLQEDGQR
ncbi:MAG: hypothetical protein LIO76_06785 [Clostridiales bacterium]|nr:hypothetical protein [Clostridiales bacterium]